MKWQGWLFMLLAWSFIGILFFYAFRRILFFDKKIKDRNNKEIFDNSKRYKNNS